MVVREAKIQGFISDGCVMKGIATFRESPKVKTSDPAFDIFFDSVNVGITFDDVVESKFSVTESGFKKITIPSVRYTVKTINPFYEPARRVCSMFAVLISILSISGFKYGFGSVQISGIIGSVLIILSTWESEKYFEKEII